MSEDEKPAGEEGDEEGRWKPADVRCDLCGGAMLERHCRLACTNCGYQRDCSDP